MQLRNDVPEEFSAVMWLAIGYPTFTPYIPFFTNATDTDPSFNNTSLTYNFDDAHWLYRSLSVLVESNYKHFVQDDLDYLKECRQELRAQVAKIDAEAKNYSGEALTDFLTKQNYETVKLMREKATDFMGRLYTKGITLSQLTFNMDRNL